MSIHTRLAHHARAGLRGMGALLLAALLVAGAGCGGGDEAGTAETGEGAGEGDIRIAYVTNGIDPFWTIAAAGVREAAREFDVEAEVLMPPKGLPDQKRMIETALANGIDGLAISPIDAENQVGFINRVCEVTNVITQDSDAPESNRLCFVGMDNYKAGREAGKLVKEAVPEGGKVMIFVGRLEQLNSQHRRQGVIDELIDAPMQDAGSIQISPPGEVVEGEQYTIVGTLTDNFDYAKAKANAEDTIASHEDLACMVGLWAYNIPNCLQAVKEAGKVGEIALVSFDEDENTLQGIVDGSVYGTISQQPYKYGYESVRILAGLARDDQSVLPEGGMLEVPSVVVRQDNVEAFWANLKELKAQGA